jgi:hypothetical protein
LLIYKLITSKNTKENMKKITKILVAISFLFTITAANAGTLNVTGNMETTYQSQAGSSTGNPLGMDRELNFSGSTELDNGMTVSVFQDTSDNLGYGNSQIAFSNSMGTIYIGSDADPIDGIDDITPSAYEEANGSGSGTYVDVGSFAGDMGIGTRIALPYGVSIDAKYYPRHTQGVKTTDNSVSGAGNSNAQNAFSGKIVADLSEAGLAGAKLTLGAAHGSFENITHSNSDEGTAALTYATGPLSIGYQIKYNQPGGVAFIDTRYKDDALGIAYAVNDALSVSFNRTTSKRNNGDTNVNGASVTNITQETDAFNIGYTIGGMTIGFQEASTDNANYTLASDDDSRTLGVSVAF